MIDNDWYYPEADELEPLDEILDVLEEIAVHRPSDSLISEEFISNDVN